MRALREALNRAMAARALPDLPQPIACLLRSDARLCDDAAREIRRYLAATSEGAPGCALQVEPHEYEQLVQHMRWYWVGPWRRLSSWREGAA